MRYLVVIRGNKPFAVNEFDLGLNFVTGGGMVVYDMGKGVYSSDGKEWIDIEVGELTN